MALPLLSIIKAIAPLIAASSGIAGSLNDRVSHSRDLATDERVRKLEDDLLRVSQVLTGSVEQLQTVAEELRVQAQLNHALRSQMRTVTIVAVAAIVLSVAALIAAFVA